LWICSLTTIYYYQGSKDKDHKKEKKDKEHKKEKKEKKDKKQESSDEDEPVQKKVAKVDAEEGDLTEKSRAWPKADN
jgi:hypothetical protein